MKSTRTLATIILTLMIITSATMTLNANMIKNARAQETPPTTVYISPAANSYAPGEKFNISINIQSADRIHSWILDILFDPQILNCSSPCEGPWTSQGGTYVTSFDYYINNTLGLARLTDGIRGTYTASGGGVMANVTFQVKQAGLTKLDLNNTKMIKHFFPGTSWAWAYPTEIDAFFQYPSTIVAVQPSNIFEVLGVSFTTNITAINIFNMTTWAMNFTWDPTILSLQDVQEGPWNTTGSTIFNYTLSSGGDMVSLNSTIEASDGETGDRTLITMNFTVVAKGVSSLNLTDVTLLSKYGTPHVVQILNGEFFSIAKMMTQPSSIIDKTLLPGKPVNLNLTILNVENLNTWSANLTWNPSILSLTEVTEGTFLSSQNTTTFAYVIDQQAGSVQLSCNLTAGSGANGSGVLAMFTFNVTTGGTFNFGIVDSSLTNINGGDLLHAVRGTEFDNRIHDIAITSITLSKQTVEQEGSVTISVTILNNGSISENFSLTIKFGAAVVDKETVTNLQPLQSKTVQVEYSVGDLPGDVYKVSAKIDYLPGEENYSNNIRTSDLTVEAPPAGFTLGWDMIAAIIIIVAVVLVAVTVFMVRKRGKVQK
jgi:hypothetical protein